MRLTSMLLVAATVSACNRDVEELAPIRRVGLDEIEVLVPSVGFTSVREVLYHGGGIWVLDAAAPFVTRVGAIVTQVGAEGGGPAEFVRPAAMAPHPEGVRVFDMGSRRATTVAPDGAFLSSDRLVAPPAFRVRANIREVSYADPLRVRTRGADALFTRFRAAVDRTADIADGVLVRESRGGGEATPLAVFADLIVSSAPRVEWMEVPLWDLCDSTLVVWSPAESHLLWLDDHGAIQARTPLKVPARAIGPSDVEAYLRWMARVELGPSWESNSTDIAAMAARSVDRFATTAPLATDLRCGSEGTAWVRLFDTRSDPLGRGPEWIQVGRSGAVSRVVFPPEFVPWLFRSADVVGVLSNGTGPERLARWVYPDQTRGVSRISSPPTPR